MTDSLDDVIQNWPENPGNAAERLRGYYGEPDEYSDTGIIWYNTSDGWKPTVLSKEEIPHNFPAPHTDYLEQFIDYKVPLEFYSKLAEYDGSVIAERTKGELSARCGGTSMNFVAINLAHDIITGKRTVGEARQEYSLNGVKPPYTQSFQFELPVQNTADMDVEIYSITD